MKRVRTLKDKLVSNKIWTSFSWLSPAPDPTGWSRSESGMAEGGVVDPASVVLRNEVL